MSTLPTMQCIHCVTSLEAVYQITCIFLWSHKNTLFFLFTYIVPLPNTCKHKYNDKELVQSPFNLNTLINKLLVEAPQTTWLKFCVWRRRNDTIKSFEKAIEWTLSLCFISVIIIVSPHETHINLVSLLFMSNVAHIPLFILTTMFLAPVSYE